ncbi:hypothetical protein SK128_001447 [Halocaridina rubra]|uniref:Uncharacterized protein n=1 Tax=Halocaridina rubra TaxID=373956 RepID=A0AAN8X7Z3_HALRR
MNTPKDYILALVAETKNDNSRREYVSGGIYATVLTADNGVPKVISSDIMGPTWFPSVSVADDDIQNPYKIAPGAVTAVNVEAAILSGDIFSLDEMRRKIIDSSWRLSEFAAEEMCDFTFVKQAPILNLLNAFEYMMDNVFKTAANLAATNNAEMAKNNPWKNTVVQRMVERKLTPFESMPPHLPYERTVDLLKRRIKDFDEGLLKDSTTTHHANNRTEDYVVPSVSTVLTNVVASVREGVYPRIVGTFYEAILGYDVMSLLAPMISAEYVALLSRASKAPFPPKMVQLDKYVINSRLAIPQGGSVTESEKRWIENERKRVKTSAEMAFRNHEFIPKAIDGVLGPRRSQEALRALERETNEITTPAELEHYIIRKRQVNFSNFSLLRLGGDEAPRFVMYALWNALFLSTDVDKNLGQRELTRNLQMCVLALDPEAIPETNIGNLIVQILLLCPGENLITNNKSSSSYADIGITGKLKQQQQDEDIRNLYKVDKKEYSLEAAKYIKVSKGFSALAFYLLYAATATSSPIQKYRLTADEGGDTLDRSVLLLISRWADVRFPTHNLWGKDNKGDTSTSSLVAFAAMWALRNAVRSRRQVNDPTNTNFIPGRPLPLLAAFSSRVHLDRLLQNSYLQARNINSENLVWRAFEEMRRESEIWYASKEKTPNHHHLRVLTSTSTSSGTNLGGMTARLAVEPAGLIPNIDVITNNPTHTTTPSDEIGKYVENNEDVNKGLKMLLTDGRIALSVTDLRSFSKETFAKMKTFPITPFDF